MYLFSLPMQVLMIQGFLAARKQPISMHLPAFSFPSLLFQVLMIQGFLALRKHADRVLLLVEMMQGEQ